MRKKLTQQLRQAIRDRRFGKQRHIYLIGNDKLAKGKSKQSSKAEHRWGRYLYKKGIQVPKMHGLIRPDSIILRSTYETLIEEWFAVMQKIKGQDIIDTEGAEREEAVRQYRQELEKVLDLGICPYDSSWRANAIFGEDEKLYLIDFELWEKGSASDLDRYYRRIRKRKLIFR